MFEVWRSALASGVLVRNRLRCPPPPSQTTQRDPVSCDSRLRHHTATLTYRQNEAHLADRGDLVAWSRTRSFGEPPAQRQWRPRRRAQSWSAEPGPGGPGGPGVGADGQHACALVSDTRKSSTERRRSPVEVVPFCSSFRVLRIASLSLSVLVCVQVKVFL